MWVFADSSNGYFVDVDVYVGRASDGVTRQHGLGERGSHRSLPTEATGFSATIFSHHLLYLMSSTLKGCMLAAQFAVIDATTRWR